LTTTRIGGLVLALSLACSGCASAPPPPHEDRAPEFEFRLGAGDVVHLSVFGEEETLERDLAVGPDGNASLPLIGAVPLAGLTLDEARFEIRQRLVDTVLVEPVVSLSLVDMRSHVVQVVGEVERPGSVPFVRGASVLGALQAAGGPRAASADLGDVRVVRGRMSDPQAYTVDVEAVLAGEARDMWLLPGDLIYVPTRLLHRWERWWRQALPWADPLPDGAR
jgi:polysaccharide export outer membrane protein